MWCTLCQAACPGPVSYRQHCEGKKHMARARMAGRYQAVAPPGPPVSQSVALPKPRPLADCEQRPQVPQQPVLQKSMTHLAPTNPWRVLDLRNQSQAAEAAGGPAALSVSSTAAAAPAQPVMAPVMPPTQPATAATAAIGPSALYTSPEPGGRGSDALNAVATLPKEKKGAWSLRSIRQGQAAWETAGWGLGQQDVSHLRPTHPWGRSKLPDLLQPSWEAQTQMLPGWTAPPSAQLTPGSSSSPPSDDFTSCNVFSFNEAVPTPPHVFSAGPRQPNPQGLPLTGPGDAGEPPPGLPSRRANNMMKRLPSGSLNPTETQGNQNYPTHGEMQSPTTAQSKLPVPRPPGLHHVVHTPTGLHHQMGQQATHAPWHGEPDFGQIYGNGLAVQAANWNMQVLDNYQQACPQFAAGESHSGGD